MSLHFLTSPPGEVIFATALFFLAVVVFLLLPAALKGRAKAAASREFEGAKPALIHAADTTIDKLPDTLDVAGLETEGRAALTALLHRLLASNPLLAGGSALLIGLLPLAFAALPKTVDVAAYKAHLKDALHKLITEARL